jgi:drug/metabolite transporter (DMT)-like permease
MMAGCGFCGTAAQSCTVQAYAEAEATQIAPFSYTQLVFAGGFGFLVFGEVPDGWTVAGAAIVIASTLYIARRRATLGQPPQPITATPDVTPPA